MESEGFDVEEWDAEFLDQLVQAEERALSTQASRNYHHRPEPPPFPPPMCDISYSPPRELSQRVMRDETPLAGGITDCFDSFVPRGDYSAKQEEIDRLKKELNRVCKQLNHLEQECGELKKAKDKKEEELKVLHSRIEAKDAEACLTKNSEIVTASGIPAVLNVNASNNKGQNVAHDAPAAQTDKTTEASTSTSTAKSGSYGSEKLIGLWNSQDQKLGRHLAAKLFTTCEADFHVLFGYLKSPRNDSNMTQTDTLCPTRPAEATKISHLYSVLTMISNDAVRLEDLFEALVDLCNLTNVVIIHRALHVLHTILSNYFFMGRPFGRRENVLIDESLSGNIKFEANGCVNLESRNLNFENLVQILKEGQFSCGLTLQNVGNPGCSWSSDHRCGPSVPDIYWVSLFQRLCHIAVINNKEQIRLEALSIMNLILMRQNAYLERDKFVGEHVFQGISKFLRREAGFCVQDQAVQTLYLLCNCPKVIALVCSGSEEDGELPNSQDVGGKSCFTFQELDDILAGLADCVACHGSSTADELKLRRNAIVFLAFLGSSGKSGFEILLSQRLPKGANVLQIVLQGLVSDLDLDLQASKSAPGLGPVREQWMFIREALIFLNRLVSHPQYSVPVLQALTNPREMASMTVDVACRLTQRKKLFWRDSCTINQIRESEIVDLAWVFRKRVFMFLGNSVS